MALLDGGRHSLRLTANAPVQQFAGGGTFLLAYFGLGVEHLLFGPDHILFVLGLVLLVSGWRRLVYVITAFTLAHSLTLGLSMLGRISAPSAVVEAIIALSILFVAIELLQRPEKRSPLAQNYPQAMAFGFGLLHGFGFADVGGHRPAARRRNLGFGAVQYRAGSGAIIGRRGNSLIHALCETATDDGIGTA